MRTEKLISRHPLTNGLTLEFWDCSRPLVGDRWLVALEARIAIPLDVATLPPELAAQGPQIAKALGPTLVFRQREERNFIDAVEFENTIIEMKDRLLKLAPAYFGHPEFAARFIRKKFADYLERQRWQRPQTR